MAIRTVEPKRVQGNLLSGMVMRYFCYMQLSIALGFAGTWLWDLLKHGQLLRGTLENMYEALLLLK
jgi:hypothetical protein